MLKKTINEKIKLEKVLPLLFYKNQKVISLNKDQKVKLKLMVQSLRSYTVAVELEGKDKVKVVTIKDTIRDKNTVKAKEMVKNTVKMDTTFKVA